jgi:hypothetical protein
MPRGPKGEKRPADVIGNAIQMPEPQYEDGNHCHAVALYSVWYNFCRIHKTLKVAPAMAAGVTGKLWNMEESLH